MARALKESPDDPSASDEQRNIRAHLGAWIDQLQPGLKGPP